MSTRQSQAEALERHAGMRKRQDLIVYRLAGDDQRSWLNGQITNDVRNTTAGQGVYALAITVKGRVMADVWALDLGEDGLAVALPRAAAEAVIERFEDQIIMEDVELTAAPELVVVSVQGPQSEAVVAGLRDHAGVWVCSADELELGGHFVLVPELSLSEIWPQLEAALSAVGGLLIAEPAWELVRLGRGRPRFGVDFGPETYPQEAGLKARAVSFNKGCYVGQEVVCTLENRGKLPRVLCRIGSETELTPGTVVTSEDGREIGKVTSAVATGDGARFIGLALLKRAQAEVGATLSAGAAMVNVLGTVEGA